jgi:hypothetical protein
MYGCLLACHWNNVPLLSIVMSKDKPDAALIADAVVGQGCDVEPVVVKVNDIKSESPLAAKVLATKV